MATGIVIPHASGTRIVVSEVHVEDAWRGVLEGIPGENFFHARLVRESARWLGREVRARAIAHPPLDEETRAHPFDERYGPPARHAPRWIVSAAADVIDAHADVERRAMTFSWFTNNPFEHAIEELLVSGMHDMPLDGDIAPVPPDGRYPWPSHTTRDAATIYADSFTLRFAFDGAPADALRVLAPVQRRFVAVPLFVDGVFVDAGDAPVLACAEFNGPKIEGPRNPDAAEYYQSELSLAWIAPAPGDTPLTLMLRDVVTGVVWHEMATPTLGP